MIVMEVRSTVKEAMQRFARLSRVEQDLATAKALTFTAQIDQAAEVSEMRRVFDRPTPFALNSVRVQPATVRRQTASVYLKDEAGKGTPAEYYLGPEIAGGPRRHKRFEMALIAAGLMPSEMFAVPGDRAPLDAYGNVPGPFIVQMLSALGAGERTSGYLANRTARSRQRNPQRAEYFVGKPGNGKAPLGIWQRVGTGARPIFMFVKAPQYKPRYDFYGIAQRSSEQAFPAALDREMKSAITHTVG